MAAIKLVVRLASVPCFCHDCDIQVLSVHNVYDCLEFIVREAASIYVHS